MNRALLTAIAAAALSFPVAAAAFAGDYDRPDYRRDEYRRGDNDHDHRSRYVVHYHLDGSRTLQSDTHGRAHDRVAFLRSLGAEAHLDNARVVHFHMHGTRKLSHPSHREAHELAERLRNYGFHAHVDHD